MNKYQKLVQERFLDNEEAVINALKSTYETSYEDITKKIKSLDMSIERLQKAYDSIKGEEIGELAQAFLKNKRNLTPEEAKETLQSMLQSKVYQRDYQKALEKQIDGVLGKMLDKEYKTIADYLQECYEDGFIGTMFDLQGQGIPLCFPLDQEAMVQAVQLDSPIKQGLYNHLGENVGDLKKTIASEVSRGISTGMSFEQVARQISINMMGTYENPGGSYAYALRIARTEGHRIQCQGTMDACYKAKEKGADVVKQWDSTLDGNTRESHQQVDGEIRELDEKFSNGLMFPGDASGGAAEVVNCRCALLQRARWAVGGSFTKYDRFSNEIKEFEDVEAYNEFKKAYFSKENKQYMNYVEKLEDRYQTKDFNKLLKSMNEQEYNHFIKLQKNRPMFSMMYRQNGGKIGSVEWETERTEKAKKYYDKIKNNNDVELIAKSSGMTIEEIQTIKKHIFFDEHIKYDGTKSVFDADYDMAVAWKRLAEGIPENRDILLLQHELLENSVEKMYNLSAAEAHAIADEKYPWYDTLIKELGDGGEIDDLL